MSKNIQHLIQYEMGILFLQPMCRKDHDLGPLWLKSQPLLIHKDSQHVKGKSNYRNLISSPEPMLRKGNGGRSAWCWGLYQIYPRTSRTSWGVLGDLWVCCFFPSHIKPHEAIYPEFLQPIGFIYMVLAVLPTFIININQVYRYKCTYHTSGSCGFLCFEISKVGHLSPAKL